MKTQRKACAATGMMLGSIVTVFSTISVTVTVVVVTFSVVWKTKNSNTYITLSSKKTTSTSIGENFLIIEENC